jgi:hypothetical protein
LIHTQFGPRESVLRHIDRSKNVVLLEHDGGVDEFLLNYLL